MHLLCRQYLLPLPAMAATMSLASPIHVVDLYSNGRGTTGFDN